MSEHFRIRSIPPRTTLDALRKQKGRLLSKEPGQRSFEQNSGGFREPITSLIILKAERITWEVEMYEGYATQGSLGVILRFSGIEFPEAPVFKKSRHDYGPDSRVFYSPVGYKNGQAFLILATYGDIFESQVVATKMDIRPFFREEIYLPKLTVTYDPTSMTLYEKNHLVVVNYNKL